MPTWPLSYNDINKNEIVTNHGPCPECGCDYCFCKPPKSLTISLFHGREPEPESNSNPARYPLDFCDPCASGQIELNYHFGHPIHFTPSYDLYAWPPFPWGPGGGPYNRSDTMTNETKQHLWEFYVGDNADPESYPTIGSCSASYALETLGQNPRVSWIQAPAPYNVARIKYIRLSCDPFSGYVPINGVPNNLEMPNKPYLIIELETIFEYGGNLIAGSASLVEFNQGTNMNVPGWRESFCNPFYCMRHLVRYSGYGQFDGYVNFARSTICNENHFGIYPNIKAIITE